MHSGALKKINICSGSHSWLLSPAQHTCGWMETMFQSDFSLCRQTPKQSWTFQMYQKEGNTKLSLSSNMAKAKSFSVECLSCLGGNEWFLCTKPFINVGSPDGVYSLSIITRLFIVCPCSSLEISRKSMFMPQSLIATVLGYSLEQVPVPACGLWKEQDVLSQKWKMVEHDQCLFICIWQTADITLWVPCPYVSLLHSKYILIKCFCRLCTYPYKYFKPHAFYIYIYRNNTGTHQA